MKGKQELFINDSTPEKNDDNIKNKREYYEKRTSAYENSVIREFAAPTQETCKRSIH